MKKGDAAVLSVKKVLRMGELPDESIYSCEILRFDEKRAELYCLLQSGKLTDLSLDVIYECQIQSGQEQLTCTGRITERYSGEEGKTFRLKIQNGFYKNIK